MSVHFSLFLFYTKRVYDNYEGLSKVRKTTCVKLKFRKIVDKSLSLHHYGGIFLPPLFRSLC